MNGVAGEGENRDPRLREPLPHPSPGHPLETPSVKTTHIFALSPPPRTRHSPRNIPAGGFVQCPGLPAGQKREGERATHRGRFHGLVAFPTETVHRSQSHGKGSTRSRLSRFSHSEMAEASGVRRADFPGQAGVRCPPLNLCPPPPQPTTQVRKSQPPPPPAMRPRGAVHGGPGERSPHADPDPGPCGGGGGSGRPGQGLS